MTNYLIILCCVIWPLITDSAMIENKIVNNLWQLCKVILRDLTLNLMGGSNFCCKHHCKFLICQCWNVHAKMPGFPWEEDTIFFFCLLSFNKPSVNLGLVEWLFVSCGGEDYELLAFILKLLSPKILRKIMTKQ